MNKYDLLNKLQNAVHCNVRCVFKLYAVYHRLWCAQMSL